MLIQKSNPTGIDKEINAIQKRVYDSLILKGWTNYESYHRVYKNWKEENKLPEVYLASGEYSECLFNDKFNATSFFLPSDSKTKISGSIYEQKVYFIFQVKLDKLKPSILHRPDEEIENDVIKTLNNYGYDENIVSIELGTDNVYNNLILNKTYKEKIRITDISYLHVFAIAMNLIYKIDNCA